MSKKVIEDYFLSLIRTHKVGGSRSLTFFLCAEDSMFEERKSGESVVGNLLGKIKRGVLGAEDWGVDTEKKTKVKYYITRTCLKRKIPSYNYS